MEAFCPVCEEFTRFHVDESTDEFGREEVWNICLDCGCEFDDDELDEAYLYHYEDKQAA